MPLRKLCSNCGSSDISRDAFAEWDVDTQSWQLVSLYDNYYCTDCDATTKWCEDEEITQ